VPPHRPRDLDKFPDAPYELSDAELTERYGDVVDSFLCALQEPSELDLFVERLTEACRKVEEREAKQLSRAS
jgi:hypothetical protein